MSAALLTTIAVVSLAGGALTILLIRQYSGSGLPMLTVTSGELGGYTLRGLVVSSVFGLYLELLMIRWVSSEIGIFAYFKNFVLIACFLGFGIGCYLCRRAVALAPLVGPLVFVTAVVELPLRWLRDLVHSLPLLLAGSTDVHIWDALPTQSSALAFGNLLLAAAVILPLFALIALVFVPVGQLVGFYLEAAPNGIRAYTVNVLASVGGIALYTALCFLDQPPMVWLDVAALLALALFLRQRRALLLTLGGFALCIALIGIGDQARPLTLWSPYQKLSIHPRFFGGERIGYELATNDSWYQNVVDLSPRFAATHPRVFRDYPGVNGYDLPYRFAPRPRSVLILGAGMGNDVAGALRNGASAVTAVEIDPLIVRLGRELHPEAPYASPRVRVVTDDARSYVQNSRERFDLIVFALLDSHTTTSAFSNIRIDNYVYTREALTAAARLLSPDGIFVVKFQVEQPWIGGRLYDLLNGVFGAPPLFLEVPPFWYAASSRLFVTGSRPAITARLAADPLLVPLLRRYGGMTIQHVETTTDDWPYFYQRDRGVPTSVLTISALLLLASIAAAKPAGLTLRRIHWELFFLGGGFLLLESQIISRMALLFGTTWIVNSIVITVVLLLIVAANGAAAAFPRMPIALAFGGIIVAIAACYIIPLPALFFRSFVRRAVLATLVLCLPVFFAGIVFIRRFAAAGFAAEAIGSNLLGALAGGIVESLSLWLGLRSLLLMAMAFYVAAWLSPAIIQRTART